MGRAVLYGDWRELGVWLRTAKTKPISAGIKKAFDILGKAVSERLKFHIREQDLPWPSISPNTRKKSPKILFESGEFMNSIDHRVTTSGRYHIQVDITPRGTHSKAKLPMGLLASYFEYGTSKMPARPLWRPVMNEIPMMPEWKEMLKTSVKLGFGML